MFSYNVTYWLSLNTDNSRLSISQSNFIYSAHFMQVIAICDSHVTDSHKLITQKLEMY